MSLAGLVLLAGAAWGVTRSRIFDLRSLQVSGAVHLTSADVARVGGLTPRTNVLWLSTGSLERRLESNPWIRDARISRTLPGTLSIVILERTPAAILAGSHVLISSEGVVLGPAGPGTHLPRMSSDAAGGPPPDATRLPAGLPSLEVIRSLPTSLGTRVALVDLDPRRGLTLNLRDGVKVFLGGADRAQAKSMALLAMLRWIERNGVRPRYIDLTVPTAPALLPAGSRSTSPAA
jgi:cell division protein FtsQ